MLQPLAVAEGAGHVQIAISTLLQALGRNPERNLTDLADDLAEAISAHHAGYELRPIDLPGAYRLGLDTKRPAGRALIQGVFARDEALANSKLASLILRTSDHTIATDSERLGEIVVSLLFNEEESDLTPHVLEHNESVAVELLRSAIPKFRQPLPS